MERAEDDGVSLVGSGAAVDIEHVQRRIRSNQRMRHVSLLRTQREWESGREGQSE